MSHDGSWRDSCAVAPFEIASTAASTRRDRSRRWLWRLVRLFVRHDSRLPLWCRLRCLGKDCSSLSNKNVDGGNRLQCSKATKKPSELPLLRPQPLARTWIFLLHL